jgi:hypothetical protein
MTWRRSDTMRRRSESIDPHLFTASPPHTFTPSIPHPLIPHPSSLILSLVLCCAGLAPGAEPGKWTDTRVLGPFICWSDFPLGDVDPLLDELEQLQSDLTETLGVPPASERIHLYLLHSKAAYSQFLARNFPKVDYRRALYVKKVIGPGIVLAQRSPELAGDLRHESTHALLHAVLPDVPLWLDEGLAKHFEAPRARRAYDHPYLNSVQWTVARAGLSSVEDLERRSVLSDMGNPEYRSAWAWVHFLLHGPPPGREELVAYLSDVRLGCATASLSVRLHNRIPAIDRVIATHFSTWRPAPARPLAVQAMGRD